MEVELAQGSAPVEPAPLSPVDGSEASAMGPDRAAADGVRPVVAPGASPVATVMAPLPPTDSVEGKVPSPKPPPPPNPPQARAESKPAEASPVSQPLAEEPRVFRGDAERLKARLLELAAGSPAPPPTDAEGTVAAVPAAGGQIRPTMERPLPPTPSQLPPAVFNSLPERRLVAHVYAPSPQQRFVILNGGKMREGDTDSRGLTLEEILPDGMILSFRGHRFYVSR